MDDLIGAMNEKNAEELRKAREAIVAAITILQAAGVKVPMELHMAAHVLRQALRPKRLTLERTTIN